MSSQHVSRTGLTVEFNSNLTCICFWHPLDLTGPLSNAGSHRSHALTQQVLHDGLVVLPEVVEGAPARVTIREGVGLNPAPAGVAEEVLTGIHRAVQRAEDGAGDGDAGFRQAHGGRPWGGRDGFSSSAAAG